MKTTINLFENFALIRFYKSKLLITFFILFASTSFSATITSTATGGNWNAGASWVGGIAPTTADNIVITNGATITLTAVATITNITIDAGGNLNIGSIQPLTVTGDFLNSGNFIGTTGRLYLTGTTKNFTNLGTISMGSGRLHLYGNIINFGTHSFIGTQFRFYGAATQSVAGFTTSGAVQMRKNGGTATFLGNVNGAALQIITAGGTLNLGTGLTHTFTGVITLTSGSLNANSSVLNVKSNSTSAWKGTGTVFTAGTGTVNFTGTGNQTLAATTTTFNNLTFSTAGVKTITATNCVVNGLLSIEGTATVSNTPVYGTNATLTYNTATSRNAGPEWITPFSANGGVIISNTGTITMNVAKVFNTSSPLTINAGATLNTNNLQLTFGGNFINNGSFTAGSAPIAIASTMTTQSIAGFSTTGLVSMTKTAGVATLIGNSTCNGITINGSGGTLNLGSSLTHTSNGNVTLTSGTLNGGSSLLHVNDLSTTAWNGTGSVFNAGTGHVNFSGNGNQTLSATTTTFNNLTFSATGIKTITASNCIVNGILSIEGTASVSNTPVFGTNATLIYNTATSRSAGPEWITPFSALGGVIISNTGTITLNAAKVFNASSPLILNSGATLNTNSLQLTLGGNFIAIGTFTAGSSPIVIANTMTVQTITGFSTTGLVSMTKTSGTATLTGNINCSGITINGSGGTLNLGTSLSHKLSTDLTRTAGTLNCGSSTLSLGNTISGTAGTFTANTGTINYNGTNQNIVNLPYYNLTLSGSGTKTFAASTTISNTISITTGAVANLGVGFTHTSAGLSLGNIFQAVGSWGGTTSGAANINSTFFATATGKINNNCITLSIVTQPSNPTTTCSNSGTQSMTVTATGSGIVYSWRKSGITIANNATISGQGTKTLTLTNPLTTDAGSYDVVLTGACLNTATSTAATVTVNPSPIISTQPVPLNVCQNNNGTFSVASSTSGVTYQWQYSTNPVGTWINTTALSGVSGHTTNTLNLTAIATSFTNRNFRCVLTASTGCVTNSNTVLLVVNSTPTIGTISGTQTICKGSLLTNVITLSSATGTIQWQRADNASFTANLLNIGTNSATLSTSQVGVLNATTYFRALVTNGVCSPLISNTVAATISTTTWTSAAGGSWDNGLPNGLKSAIFSTNYTSTANSNFTACTLTVNNNANVIFTTGNNVIINGEINVDTGSSLTLENNTNLIQNEDFANTGNIVIKRNTNALMRLDYSIWSSPVASQNLLNFSPLTTTNRFYEYNTPTNLFTTVTPSTTNFAAGKGYLIRVPNTHPTTPTVWAGTFTGIPNNGTYSVDLINGGAGFRFNAIGNPYPSTIDMDQFVSDNSTEITGTLYFWRKTNNTATSPGYCTWNGGTFISNGQAQVFDPNDVIQVGQGFIVEALSTGTSVVFNNDQRIADNANQTFRIAGEEQNEGRFWINLTSSLNEFSQMAITYTEDGTNAIDKFDAKYFNTSPISLNSLVDNDDYVIQSKALPFNSSEIIPLNLKVLNVGQYAISIDKVDGLFDNSSQEIYLKDNLLSTYTNLKNSNYSFASEAGTFSNRFEIVYQSSLNVSNPELNSNNVIIYKDNNEIVINTGTIEMSNVKIFDIRGRLLVEKSGINATEIKINPNSTNQVLLLQITGVDNSVVTKKIVN